ncbi:hypothetical protein NMY22_g6018 [Coprinellus aureogranulatus]|nr:hypothetical protein NMY22_g6018 [Coprinellus aureogranulatus]
MEPSVVIPNGLDDDTPQPTPAERLPVSSPLQRTLDVDLVYSVPLPEVFQSYLDADVRKTGVIHTGFRSEEFLGVTLVPTAPLIHQSGERPSRAAN